MNIRLSTSIVLASFLMAITVAAQEPAKPAADKAAATAPTPPPRNLVVALKLSVVVSKYQGDKKISSLPYVISLNSNNNRVSTRMGAQVPIAGVAVAPEGKPAPAYTYRDVGLSIDANATIYEAGIYRIDLTVDDTSISSSSQIQGASSITGVPIFRNFRGHNAVLLRDGQSTQLTSVSDPVSGETMRVDVTLNVVK